MASRNCDVGGDMRGWGRGVLGSCFASILLGASASTFAQTAGTLTLVEGSVELIRGTTLYAAAQGVAKFTQKKSSKGAQYRYLTPRAEITAGEATAVLNAGDSSTDIYIESGAVRFSEIGRKGVQRIARDAKGGEFIVRRGEQPATLGPRPSAEFLKNMPRHFRDDLPVLLDRFKNRRSEPRREHEVTYAEVEAWLKAGPSIKRNFVKRFEIRSKDSEFRHKLIENLREHPEWDKVLFPEKYEQKGPNDPKSGQSGTQR